MREHGQPDETELVVAGVSLNRGLHDLERFVDAAPSCSSALLSPCRSRNFSFNSGTLFVDEHRS
jgi:hypothetical protein